MMRISEMTTKKVINTADGKALGQINDFEIDVGGGKIAGVVLPFRERSGFLRRREYACLPWREIQKVGCDVVLVTSEPNDLPDVVFGGGDTRRLR